jgi:hypothetical protein
MTEALSELRGPATHEQLRSRMVAMLGKEDELLDPERFPRLLRQANDAEIADVRSAGDSEFEISLHRRPSYRTAEAASPAVSEGNGAAAPEPAPEPAPSAARRGVRFRRGSRAPSRSGEVPLIGVVKMADKADKLDATDKADKAGKAGKADEAGKSGSARQATPKEKKVAKSPRTPRTAKAAKATKATKSAKASKPGTRARKAATTRTTAGSAGAAPGGEAAS